MHIHVYICMCNTSAFESALTSEPTVLCRILRPGLGLRSVNDLQDWSREDPVAAGNTNATGKVFATDATTQVPTLPHLAERGDVVIH